VAAGGDTVFIGRVREFGQLTDALCGVRAGEGVAVSVAGEAGIGKTRLAHELARQARRDGFQVLLGRSIDLVGSELPYQPFVDALRPVGELAQFTEPTAGSQLKVFEETLAMLSERAVATPLLLILEDLHWADASTLDLAVFLAHNLAGRQILLLVTVRVEPGSASERMRRFIEGVRRSGSAVVLELGPLTRDDMTALVAAHADDVPSAALTDEIVSRCEGNPFFAEELLAAAGEDDGQVPRGLRDVLLARVDRLDERTKAVLRVAAAAGREVDYPLLRATATQPDQEVRESLRRAVEHGVLVAELASGRFRFRHALLAEAIYTTILPGEREELHGRIAEELARIGTAASAELARHWAAAGRSAEALQASVQAARQAQAVYGLAEAHAHLERALALWPAVPDAGEFAGLDLAALCSWAAELAVEAGAAPRAAELEQRAIELVGEDPRAATVLHVRLGRYLHAAGRGDAALAAFERAVELAPAEPPSPERAHALAAFANGLMLDWRHQESLDISRRALDVARAVGDDTAELRAMVVHATSLAYLGHTDEGLAQLRVAVERAEALAHPESLMRAYVNLTDVLMMLGRLRESADLASAALPAFRRYGLDDSTLIANQIEALVASGQWDEADRVSARAIRVTTETYPHHFPITRGELEVGRGDFEAARTHLDAAAASLRLDRDLAVYDSFLAELALWERRWDDVVDLVRHALGHAPSRDMAVIRAHLCAKGLRAQAEMAALARARRDARELRDRVGRARELLRVARDAAGKAASVTPNANGWLALAEAEYERALGVARPESWSAAAATWDQLERPPLAAYCRWRQVEAVIASGAPRTEARAPLHAAYEVATRLKAVPLQHELELVAERARLDLVSPGTEALDGQPRLEEVLGLTAREAEVLNLIARGYTNREIAEALVISIKTASVHVSHILAKLDAPNRREAAAIAHRLSPPPLRR
jgi:DNA-binding CsgD family transcriptional regulator/tetratricopeptide (TPR) repeat protein